MKSRGDKLLDAVQSKLPHTKVFWSQPKPYDKYQDMAGCTLVAVSLTDEKKKFEIQYKDGLGDHTIEDLAEDFVVHSRMMK